MYIKYKKWILMFTCCVRRRWMRKLFCENSMLCLRERMCCALHHRISTWKWLEKKWFKNVEPCWHCLCLIRFICCNFLFAFFFFYFPAFHCISQQNLRKKLTLLIILFAKQKFFQRKTNKYFLRKTQITFKRFAKQWTHRQLGDTKRR